MASPGEKIIGTELVIAMVIVSVGSIRNRKAAPTPSQFAGVVVAYGALSAVAMIHPGVAKIAGGLGGLVLLVLLVQDKGDIFGAVSGAVGKGGGTKSGGLDAAKLDQTPPDSTVLGPRPNLRSAPGTSASSTPAPAPTDPGTVPSTSGVWT